tara:strand:- start:61 stop:252 length:192 start_codon:yes stop_codon:yes gene_type:complete
MSNILENELRRQNRTLLAKLTVRSCQYNIALEGLQNIVESNDPMGIAEKTIEAMEDCVPEKDS